MRTNKCTCNDSNRSQNLFRNRLYHNSRHSRFSHHSLFGKNLSWLLPEIWEDSDINLYLSLKAESPSFNFKYPSASKSSMQKLHNLECLSCVWLLQDSKKDSLGFVEFYFSESKISKGCLQFLMSEKCYSVDINYAIALVVSEVFIVSSPSLISVLSNIPIKKLESFLHYERKNLYRLHTSLELLTHSSLKQILKVDSILISNEDWRSKDIGKKTIKELNYVSLKVKREEAKITSKTNKRSKSLLSRIFRPRSDR